MPPAAIATLVFAACLVLALAATLVLVVVVLRRITRTLGGVSSSVRAIADRTAGLTSALEAVNTDLRAIADGMEGLVRSPEPGQAEDGELPAQHR